MKKRKLIISLSLICGMILVSCDDQTNNNITTSCYTVIWQNINGDILEIDKNVLKGSIPSYEGNTPCITNDEEYSYTFIGWDKEIKAVESNITYTAKYQASINTYTVTWKNFDGSILEVDENVPYGTIPSYNGITPKKENNGNISYNFTGWTPSISKVISDTTYTATFKEIINGSSEGIPGIDPVFSSDGKQVEYGFYPQTHVNDLEVIEILNSLEPNENGWYNCNNEYYTKETAKIFNNESYSFDDGTIINEGSDYWFKCEPIKWNVLTSNEGTYILLSSLLLDAHNYYQDYADRNINNKTIYANNYEHSEIRSFLNNEFYNKVFALNSDYIIETNVNNSASTSDANKNTYTCSNTLDKVYLLSYQDYLNVDYGFDNNNDSASFSRETRTTDYTRAKGAWCNTREDLGLDSIYNGTYWTRTPTSEYYYCAWNISSGGYLSTYAVDGTSHSVRPCITLSII